MPPVTWLLLDFQRVLATCPVLIGICVAMTVSYIIQKLSGKSAPLARVMVFFPPTLRAGEIWRLVTHVLLHSDFSHLFTNLLHILNTLDPRVLPQALATQVATPWDRRTQHVLLLLQQ